jgi:hypothetical protein
MGIYKMAGNKELKKRIEKIQENFLNVKNRPPSSIMHYE